MPSIEDVRRIAALLPGSIESPDRNGYSVMLKGKPKSFLWVWQERVHPKKPRVPNLSVLVVLVSSLSEKEILLGSDDAKFFTEPHYNGFPAIFVRLDVVTLDELDDLIVSAWRSKAPLELQRRLEND